MRFSAEECVGGLTKKNNCDRQKKPDDFFFILASQFNTRRACVHFTLLFKGVAFNTDNVFY